MPLPPFAETGDLPVGIHRASLAEVLTRFGRGSAQREDVARRLERIYNTARATGFLARLIVFGSFVTDKAEPNDVDVFMVMDDSFQPADLSGDAAVLFDHLLSKGGLGASVFWSKRSGLVGGEQRFIEGWQTKRDLSLRGIVEIIPEVP
jgi:hypothetical protein